jgi:hypothetical protein
MLTARGATVTSGEVGGITPSAEPANPCSDRAQAGMWSARALRAPSALPLFPGKLERDPRLALPGRGSPPRQQARRTGHPTPEGKEVAPEEDQAEWARPTAFAGQRCPRGALPVPGSVCAFAPEIGSFREGNKYGR